MCEIKGMSFNFRERQEFLIKKFLERGVYYSNGWGLGFYPDASFRSLEETKPMKGSFDIFLKNLTIFRSQIFVGQLRNSTIGGTGHRNNHPFSRELKGKEYVFVHNGTLYKYRDLETGQFQPMGDTDSEYFFCHLMNHIAGKKCHMWTQRDFRRFSDFLLGISILCVVKCVFSDGEYLFTYYDKGEVYELYYTNTVSEITVTGSWMNS